MTLGSNDALLIHELRSVLLEAKKLEEEGINAQESSEIKEIKHALAWYLFSLRQYIVNLKNVLGLLGDLSEEPHCEENIRHISLYDLDRLDRTVNKQFFTIKLAYGSYIKTQPAIDSFIKMAVINVKQRKWNLEQAKRIENEFK